MALSGCAQQPQADPSSPVISDSLLLEALQTGMQCVLRKRPIEKVWTKNNADSKGSLTPAFHHIGPMQEFRVVDNFSKKEIWLRDFRKHLEMELWLNSSVLKLGFLD